MTFQQIRDGLGWCVVWNEDQSLVVASSVYLAGVRETANHLRAEQLAQRFDLTLGCSNKERQTV